MLQQVWCINAVAGSGCIHAAAGVRMHSPTVHKMTDTCQNITQYDCHRSNSNGMHYQLLWAFASLSLVN